MKAALALPFYLKGVARAWYDSLQEETQKNMALLKPAFLSRLKNAYHVDLSVLTINQRVEESAEEYFSRFIDNSNK